MNNITRNQTQVTSAGIVLQDGDTLFHTSHIASGTVQAYIRSAGYNQMLFADDFVYAYEPGGSTYIDKTNYKTGTTIHQMSFADSSSNWWGTFCLLEKDRFYVITTIEEGDGPNTTHLYIDEFDFRGITPPNTATNYLNRTVTNTNLNIRSLSAVNGKLVMIYEEELYDSGFANYQGFTLRYAIFDPDTHVFSDHIIFSMNSDYECDWTDNTNAAICVVGNKIYGWEGYDDTSGSPHVAHARTFIIDVENDTSLYHELSETVDNGDAKEGIYTNQLVPDINTGYVYSAYYKNGTTWYYCRINSDGSLTDLLNVQTMFYNEFTYIASGGTTRYFITRANSGSPDYNTLLKVYDESGNVIESGLLVGGMGYPFYPDRAIDESNNSFIFYNSSDEIRRYYIDTQTDELIYTITRDTDVPSGWTLMTKARGTVIVSCTCVLWDDLDTEICLRNSASATIRVNNCSFENNGPLLGVGIEGNYNLSSSVLAYFYITGGDFNCKGDDIVMNPGAFAYLNGVASSNFDNSLGNIIRLYGGEGQVIQSDTEPTVTYPDMIWIDTSSNSINVRDKADSAWVTFTPGIAGDGISKITVSATEPVSPVEGDVWIDIG